MTLASLVFPFKTLVGPDSLSASTFFFLDSISRLFNVRASVTGCLACGVSIEPVRASQLKKNKIFYGFGYFISDFTSDFCWW